MLTLPPSYKELYHQLTGYISKDRLITSPLELLAFGTDASFYRLIPKIVVKANDMAEVSRILATCHQRDIPVTFRAAGTSLSGQAISDSVLIVAGTNWRKLEILENGEKIRLQPGVIGGHANRLLMPYKRKIGPDPASINAAMIGGIAANNASGMCCGTKQNSYQTVDSMKILLHDGTLLDTADEGSKAAFRATHGHLLEELDAIGKETRANKRLADRIRKKFKMKNTTGYSLNALVDYEDPFDILQHLMIGSEGTLGFIGEITYKTVKEEPFKASSLMIFSDNQTAGRAVSRLKSEPVAAVELMDRAGLKSMEHSDGVPSYLKGLSPEACSLLVQTSADTHEQLHQQIEIITRALDDVPAEMPITFTDKPAEYNKFWKIRKGLYPSVGAMRKTGTTVIIEDVAFPVENIAGAIGALQELFAKYEYNETVIFGHALEGNLHFVFSQAFDNQYEIDRYEKFMDELAVLVTEGYDGSLKSEHGTGRNMAPYVQKEWGEEAYDMMKRIKAVFDPKDLLNPGVILNNDPKVHLKNLKPMPAAHEVIDKCTECGFCEPACVSQGLTLSPRQRITVYREMQRLRKTGEQPGLLTSLEKDYDYKGLQTCATDGLCAVACPVGINTGTLVKYLRRENLGKPEKALAATIAPNMDKVSGLTRFGLTAVNGVHKAIGTKAMHMIATGLRNISGKNLPQWDPFLPKGAPKIDTSAPVNGNPRKVVYFPSCINQAFGVSVDYDEKVALTGKVKQLLEKAGYEIIYPENLSSQCCGMPYSSKGFTGQAERKSNQLEQALLNASENGTYPVLSDMSPCFQSMKENIGEPLKLYDPIEFTLKFLTQQLDFTPAEETISVFAVCSAKKMGQEEDLMKLAEMCATKVIKPETACCGFAGDRGFSHPELT
ncbi:MAG: FAD-binding and (Fe-S)-binding domain-containing protein, partial [Cyclonatronaceae bacterium]